MTTAASTRERPFGTIFLLRFVVAPLTLLGWGLWCGWVLRRLNVGMTYQKLGLLIPALTHDKNVPVRSRDLCARVHLWLLCVCARACVRVRAVIRAYGYARVSACASDCI